MDDELIAAHGSVAKLMPQLHLPVQSGSDNILKAMNRKHTRDFYFNIIDKLKKVRSDITFSSDFIVGFPSETDRDFQDTIDLVERVNYSACYSFKYSPRPGTPASVNENQISQIDLARTYLESGDKAKAEEIIITVINTGDEIEKHEARLLYMQLRK